VLSRLISKSVTQSTDKVAQRWRDEPRAGDRSVATTPSTRQI
jgi:hypothetical protein